MEWNERTKLFPRIEDSRNLYNFMFEVMGEYEVAKNACSYKDPWSHAFSGGFLAAIEYCRKQIKGKINEQNCNHDFGGSFDFKCCNKCGGYFA